MSAHAASARRPLLHATYAAASAGCTLVILLLATIPDP